MWINLSRVSGEIRMERFEGVKSVMVADDTTSEKNNVFGCRNIE
jgi:hypothetical protein